MQATVQSLLSAILEILRVRHLTHIYPNFVKKDLLKVSFSLKIQR